MTYKSGDRVTDSCTGDELIIVAVNHDERIDEKTATYDYNKNAVSVYEMEQNNGNEWPPDDAVVVAVYPSMVVDRLGVENPSVETDILPAIEKKKLKPYYFPLSRIEA